MPALRSKRKATPNGDAVVQQPAPKLSKTSRTSNFDHSRPEERSGIVQREFYPAEMSNERCAMYNNGEIPKPMHVLEQTVLSTAKQREKIKADGAVVHWFKRDLRTTDNRGLHLASELAKKNDIPLVTLFVVSPQDYQAHFTSPARVDFELRTLRVLKKDLAALDIPLCVETIDNRHDIDRFILDKCKKWNAKHVFCNVEYEVDELRRETRLTKKCLDAGISFTAVHDDVVVAPGMLQSGTGRQYAVYSPWYRSWMAHIHAHPGLLDQFPRPGKNPQFARDKFKAVFDAEIPDAPENKALSEERRERFKKMWPAGEHEALERIDHFLSQKIGRYSKARNTPAMNGTSMISVHLSAGTLAARTAVRMARDTNSTKKLDAGNEGITVWISEVAWRDFYKHVLANWPYVCMFKPFKPEYTNIEWEYNDEHFKAWCEGKTGFPIVDAAMRQLQNMSYMHNRCRMIVASFIAKDLLLDWRLGEKHFMENLIDGDFASNNGGWGFSASTGVDPQPYFRIFNPLLQSEKFDPDGEYIRKWVPELRNIKGKAIHDPYGRGAETEAKKERYPKPIVNHKECRERALTRYKSGLKRDTA